MRQRIFWIALGLLLVAPAAWGAGQITGTVINDTDGDGVGGVTVVVSESGQVTLTNSKGEFRFDNVAAGSYTLAFSLGDDATSKSDVEVTDDNTTDVQMNVNWDVSFAETITVFSASRRRERIVEAPAAVTIIPEEQIQREVSHGQLPKLLEFTPGVQVTQSGNFDYNLNTRGFNSSLNRRVAVLVDGRDPSVPFLASQEWPVVSQYMNDLSGVELVRGPSSALYGKNAFNGVLNLTTKGARDSQGGNLRLNAGELATRKADLRWATALGNDWYFKINGTYGEGEDFSKDRTVSVGAPEYSQFCTAADQVECLVPEVIPRPVDVGEVTFGNIRVDKHLSNSDFFTIETGFSDYQAQSLLTGIGRFSLPSVERMWTRLNYTSRHWNALAYMNDRTGDAQTSMQSGSATYLDSNNYHIELQTNWDWNEGKVRFVGGGSYREEEIDTANPAGIQTLLFQGVESDSTALYAQLDFDLTDNIKLVLAGRFDDSTLHESIFSPKGSLVWSINPQHTLRFGYNEAFQVGNYSELFLQADAAQPIDLSGFEPICAAGGVSCGFSNPVRVLALGNQNLETEEVSSIEVGYTGILNNKAYVTLDYYRSELSNFITDLLPNVGTALGRLNPDFGGYTPPANLPEPLRSTLLGTMQAVLGPTFFALSNNLDGTPILGAATYTNFGGVDTEGIDFGLNYSINSEWKLNLSYAWFDFETQEQIPGDPLVPNAPETQYSFGLNYVGEKFDASMGYRFTDSFFWSVGTLYRGTVESYDTVDLNANYHFNDSISVGINISNAFDDEAYQLFGGDLVGRRAVGHIAFSW